MRKIVKSFGEDCGGTAKEVGICAPIEHDLKIDSRSGKRFHMVELSRVVVNVLSYLI